MFLHIYKYRLLSMIKQKEEAFWIFLFPICLSLCFFAAFSNITESTENFKTINVAVNIEDTTNSVFFKAMLDSLEDTSNGDAMLKVTYDNESSCLSLLENEDVEAVINFKNSEPEMVIKKNGINQSVLKCILDSYKQQAAVITSLKNPTMEEITNITNVFSKESYIEELKLTDGNTDNFTDYYYSLIAMTCLFGTMSGQVCANEMKANLSAKGMRKCLSSTHRFTIILGDFFATFTMHAAANTILILFLQYVLKLNIGNKLGLLLLTSYVGSIIGISIGTLIGSIPKLSENAKNGINLGISLISSFLSGLMIGGIKYEIDKTLPIVNLLNPATVLTDAMYSLNIYDTYDKYITSMTTLIIYSVVLCVLSFLISRRESYESI